MITTIDIKDKVQPDKSIKIAPFRKEVRTTRPHKHNSYFEIILLTKGLGEHTIDGQSYIIEPPVIFCIRKEQLHYWNLTSEPDGFVLIIRDKFIDTCLDNEVKGLLFHLSKYPVLHLKEVGTIVQLFEVLTRESLSENATSNLIIEGALKALLAKLLQKEVLFEKPVYSRANLYDKLREILINEKHYRNNVAYYAAQLNTSPQNLNAACRKFGERPATDVLADFIISEAKRLLLYTDGTIASIADQLSFNDASHFVKYFKRFTQATPLEFRIKRS